MKRGNSVPALLSSWKSVSFSRKVSQPKDSSIEMEVRERNWYKIRPTLAAERRKHSIKGTQAFSMYNREFYFPRNNADRFEKLVSPWIHVIALGVAITIVALLVDAGALCANWGVFSATQSAFLDPYRHGTSSDTTYLILAFVIFTLFCASFALAAGCFVLFVSPLAEGSGIPDVKSYLNGVHLKGLFSLPALLAKSLGIVCVIGSGLITGREGPIIHIGSVLGAALSQGSSKIFKWRLPSIMVKHFRSAEWKRDFAVMGSAMGVAAAFVSPMGGVLFAIEEGATVWRQQLTFLTMFGAILTAFLTSIALGYFSQPTDSPIISAILYGTYNDKEVDVMRLRDFPYVLIIGLLGGLMGSAFSYLQNNMIDIRRKYIRTNKYLPLLEIAFVSILLSCVRFGVPYLFGSCVNDNHYRASQGKQRPWAPDPAPFLCQDNEINNLGVLFWTPVPDSLEWLLYAQGVNDISTSHLVAGLVYYFGFAVLVYGLAVPSGLFIPSLIIGACYGRLVGQLAAHVTGVSNLIASYAFLGSVSALGGVTRVTISVALIALESTQNFNISLYAFMVVVIAKLTADSINIGICDMVIMKRDIPYLVDEMGYEGYQLTVRDVMTPVNGNKKLPMKHMNAIESIEAVASVARALELLSSHPNAYEFPVVSASGNLEGTIERMIILRLLECRLFGINAPLLHPSTVDSAWPNLRNEVSDQVEADLRSAILKEHNPNEIMLDLRPYIDREPAIVLASSSMRKAHQHLRHGERNIFVVESVKIVGTVKRADVMPGALEAVLRAKRKQNDTPRTDQSVGQDIDDQLTVRQQEEKQKEKHECKQAEVLSLDPFEPRFYYLLFEFLRHRSMIKVNDADKKQMVPEDNAMQSSSV